MRLLVFGAGGHAKVVIDAARAAGFDVAGVVGEPRGRTHLMGVPISENASGMDVDAFIVAVGDNRARAEIFSACVDAGLRPVTVIHPSAVIAEGVVIGDGSFIAAGVVVNADARVGADVILNTSCSVDHDCVIGEHAHVGPMSALCGGVEVGTGTLVGVGCSIIPTRSVGDWSVLGAGSVVISDIPSGETHVGVPSAAVRSSES